MAVCIGFRRAALRAEDHHVIASVECICADGTVGRGSYLHQIRAAAESPFPGKPASCLKLNQINFGGVLPDGTSRLSQDGRTLSMFFGQSSFAEYAVVAAQSAVKVPYDDIDLAVVAPMGCGIQTGAGTVLNALKPELGSSIAIFGCGTVGMSAIMAARIAGCAHNHRRGRQGSHPCAGEGAWRDPHHQSQDLPGHRRGDQEDHRRRRELCHRHQRQCELCAHCLAPLGVEAVVGIIPPMEIDMFGELMAEGKTISGVIEGAAQPKVFIPQMIEYYRQGRFPVDRIMRFYDFEDINQACEDSTSGKCIKTVVRMKK